MPKNTAQMVRLRGLRRFALAITALNLLGHTVLGFEQSYAQPIFSLATAYSVELLLEFVDARAMSRQPRFLANGFCGFVDFLLPAHITGLAVAMLLYANDRVMPFIFASTVAIGSKSIFRLRSGPGWRHFFNPSNLGISSTLLLFPAVGIAPPYMFTEGLNGVGGIALALLIVMTGTLLNAKITRRLPLILAWVGGFVLQAAVRGIFYDHFPAILNAMTGVAFVLFTFYMVTDPGTTPNDTRGQLLFGFSVACGYGLLVMFHVVFGMFFSLSLVCLCRFCFFVYQSRRRRPVPEFVAPQAARDTEIVMAS